MEYISDQITVFFAFYAKASLQVPHTDYRIAMRPALEPALDNPNGNRWSKMITRSYKACTRTALGPSGRPGKSWLQAKQKEESGARENLPIWGKSLLST